MKPKNYWKSSQNQREFLFSIAKEFNIKNDKEWGNLSNHQLKLHGGASLLRYSGSSIFNLLKRIFPEKEWKKEWFDKSIWKSFENQRKFLKQIEKEFHIQNPSDWGKISITMLEEKGLYGILNNYGRSIYKMLNSLFPEIHWNPSWFTRKPKFETGYWNILSNQRLFMESIARKFDIKKPRDWSSVTKQDFIDNGGITLLRRHNGSIYEMLKSIYSECELKKQWFEVAPTQYRGFWKNRDNERKFLDNLGEKLGIKNRKDWGSITNQRIIQLDGKTLITKYGSLYQALVNIYSEFTWDREWFIHIPKYKKTHWEDINNQRRYLESIATEYGVHNASDWQKVSTSLIRNKQGTGLLAIYNNSLAETIRVLYPGTWKISEEKTISKIQKKLHHMII